MPVASATLTAGEWRAIENEYNIAPKSFVQLGREGRWMIDDLSPADRETVLGLVPAVPRFVLLHGFGRAYRRQKQACRARRRTSDDSRRPVATRSSSTPPSTPSGMSYGTSPVSASGATSACRRHGSVGRRRRCPVPASAAGTDKASSAGAGCARSAPRSRQAHLAHRANDPLSRQFRVEHPAGGGWRRHAHRTDLPRDPGAQGVGRGLRHDPARSPRPLPGPDRRSPTTGRGRGREPGPQHP